MADPRVRRSSLEALHLQPVFCGAGLRYTNSVAIELKLNPAVILIALASAFVARRPEFAGRRQRFLPFLASQFVAIAPKTLKNRRFSGIVP